MLTEQGRQALADTLGGRCPLTTSLCVLVLGKTDAGSDVLFQQNGCVPTRFVVVPAWGELAS